MAKSKKKAKPRAIVPGGAASAIEGGIDATTSKDQGAIRKASERWPRRWLEIDDAKKRKWLDQLERAGDTADKLLKSQDPELAMKAVNAVVSVVKTAVAMVGQQQADDHLNAKIENPQAADTGPAVVFNIMLATVPPNANESRTKRLPPPQAG